MWLTVLVSFAAGLGAGIVGSLIAPWVHWGIEKKRQRLQRRQAIIDSCRRDLNIPDFDSLVFREGAAYSAIRPYIDKKVVSDLESAGGTKIFITAEGRGTGSHFRVRLLDEVAALEVRWNLI